MHAFIYLFLFIYFSANRIKVAQWKNDCLDTLQTRSSSDADKSSRRV